jgi:hypothetical protein
MSVPSPSSVHSRTPRRRLFRPIRLSSFLLLTVVATLLIALFAQRLREARLRDAISVYRHPPTEAILDALDRPIPLNYADGASLDEVLKEFRKRMGRNPALTKGTPGIPIYVDPIGLQEAERSLHSTVQRPPAADTLTLGEHLRRVLDPLGLGYQVKDGFLMIASKEEVDLPVGDDVDPYLQYRDVLR